MHPANSQERYKSPSRKSTQQNGRDSDLKVSWKKQDRFVRIKTLKPGETFIAGESIYMLVLPYEHQSDPHIRYAVNIENGIETTFDIDLGVTKISTIVSIAEQ